MGMTYHRLTVLRTKYDAYLIHKSLANHPQLLESPELYSSISPLGIAHDLLEHVFGLETMFSRTQELTAFGALFYGRYVTGNGGAGYNMPPFERLLQEAVEDVMGGLMPEDLTSYLKFNKYLNPSVQDYDEHHVLRRIMEPVWRDEIAGHFASTRKERGLTKWDKAQLTKATDRLINAVSMGYYKAFTIYGDSFKLGELFTELYIGLETILAEYKGDAVAMEDTELAIGIDRKDGYCKIGESRYGRPVYWLIK